MKQCYPKVPVILAFFTLLFYLPNSLNAQACLCENGNVPQQLTYSQTRAIRPIDDSTNFDLMQFNPTFGQLVCVNVISYITGIVRMRLENDEVYPVSYRINYQRTDNIGGPGLSPALVNSFTKNYGPYNLASSDGNYFSGPDYVQVGPDTVLKNKYLSRAVTGSLVPFLGYGNVQYNYKVSGRTTVTGSINYIFSVSSIDIVSVGVVYNYCPTGLLGTDIKDFTAAKKDMDDVQLSWTTVNESKGNKYEIEVSKNNADFKTIDVVQAKTAAGSTSSKYEYPYHMLQSAQGNVFFRIKQTTTSGKVTYTPIRQVMFEGSAKGFSIYPNPTRTKVQMQFDNLASGDFQITVVNLTGQVVHSRNIKLEEGNNLLSFELPTQPAAGVYYLRAKETNSNKTYSGKLVIQNR